MIIENDIETLAESLRSHWSDFEGKRFVITGAGGFLGKYMVHLLSYLNTHVLEKKLSAELLDNHIIGYDDPILQDRHLRFRRQNVIEPFMVDGEVDYVIHAAGIASPVYYSKYPIETLDVGSKGTRNLLELSLEKKVKSFIFMSSSEVYGDPEPSFIPTPEHYSGNVAIDGPRACYDESKRFGEVLCFTFAKTYGLPVKIVRPFNVYGPGIRPDDYRVLPNFIEHAIRGQSLPVHGEGRSTRSFCYITDQIEALFKLLFCDANGEAFNVGNPEPEISVKDLAQLVAKLVPQDAEIRHVGEPHVAYALHDPKRRCPDISKLMRTIDFEPKVNLVDGLKRTISWFQSRSLLSTGRIQSSLTKMR